MSAKRRRTLDESSDGFDNSGATESTGKEGPLKRCRDIGASLDAIEKVRGRRRRFRWPSLSPQRG